MSGLTRETFGACIPHAGTMILIDEVLEWGPESLRAQTRSHASRDNPLRTAQGLHIACGIEYAAQAMAIHAGLACGETGSAPSAGLLIGLRDVRLHGRRLDEDPAPLTIDVRRRASDGYLASYEFALRSPLRELLRGIATVILDAGAPGRAKAAGEDAGRTPPSGASAST